MIVISLVAAATIIALIERIPRLRLRPQRFFRKFFVTDFFYLLTGFVAGGSLALAYITSTAEFLGSSLSIPRLRATTLPFWIVVILALVALDAGNYAVHYCLHRFDLLWRLHKVHHSSEALDWLATFRSHIGEQILRRLLAPVLLILFGFPPKAVVIAGALFTAWAILNHANLKLDIPLLESLFITPRLHRIHHLTNDQNNNLGTVFIVWDKLRGTLDVTKYDQECELGNGERDYPQRWLRQFFKPLDRAQRR